MTQPLSSRIALVTGASRGIGYATARALARAGAHIVAVARTQGGLEELDDAIRNEGGTATLVPLDLTDRDGIARLGAALHEKRAGNVTPDFSWTVREAAEILVRLFHPMMPHLAEECWAELGHGTLVAAEAWPAVEKALLVENTVTLPVQINGKKRADVTVPRDAKNAEIEAAVLALDAVQRALDGKRPKKVIVVPQRIVNVVA